MKNILFALAILVGAAGATIAQTIEQQRFNLTQVFTDEDAQKCAQNKGKGALVFELDGAGAPASQPGAFCLTPVE